MRTLPWRLGHWLLILVVCACSGDRAISPILLAAAKRTAPGRLFVVATVTSGGVPVTSANLRIRSSGQWWVSTTTDDRGKCTLDLPARSGYFEAEASLDGGSVTQWNSLPLNTGQEYRATLDLDGSRTLTGIPHPETGRFTLPGSGQVEMVLIRAGRFQMGSPAWEPGRSADEGPVSEVHLTHDFYVSRCEITQDQWQNVMGTSPWETFRQALYRIGNPDGTPVPVSRGSHPAESVSWEEAVAFVDAFNRYSKGPAYRLLTEAEWEYVARASSNEPWGDAVVDQENYAWFEANTVGAGLVSPLHWWVPGRPERADLGPTRRLRVSVPEGRSGGAFTGGP